ncbi:hypothetical protein TFLX_03015 [Thermoflexales bacterium]|nr:hypothetical protein TFLX_03015 [Thermoflexales bacterium]
MSSNDKLSLWIDFAQSQYYLIPEEQELSSGELRLVTLTGRARHVDPDAVSQWAVSETAAQAHMQAAALDFLSGAKSKLADLFSAAASAVEVEEEAAAPDQVAAEPTLDLTLLLLGIPTEALKRDPALGGLGLHNIVKTLANLLGDVISGEETRLAAARERVRLFRAELEKSGVQAHPRLEALPDKIHAWYTATGDKSAFHQVEGMLQTTAARLRLAYEKGEVDYQSILADLIQDVRSVFAEEEETYEQRQQRYREMARSSIEATGVPKFDFKKLWAEYNQNENQAP